MPVIHFTAADKLAGKVMEKGGGQAILSSFRAEAAKSQKSVNYWCTFRLTSGLYLGKELDCCFNTESNSPSLLGNMKFFPSNYLLRVIAATQGIKFDDLPNEQDIDTDQLINKPLDITWDTIAVDGDLVNVITNFLPTGKATAAVPF